MIVYIQEDTLHFIYKCKLVSVKCSNCLQEGYIVNKEIFMQEFSKVIKRIKIKNKLFGDNITVINNGYFTVGDLFFIENIFSELGFIKIYFKSIRDLLDRDNVTYVEINNNYIVLYLDKVIYLSIKYFKDIPKILNFLKEFLNKNIVLFGLNKCIPEMSNKNVYIYYMENFKDYITQSLLKVENNEV